MMVTAPATAADLTRVALHRTLSAIKAAKEINRQVANLNTMLASLEETMMELREALKGAR